MDAIICMIRCFDSDIQNVNTTVDPIRDIEIIETEMKLADLESIQKRLEKNNKKNIEEEQLEIFKISQDLINKDKDILEIKINLIKTNSSERLIISKTKIFVCNVDEQSVQKGK